MKKYFVTITRQFGRPVQRFVVLAILAFSVLGIANPTVVQACPMCKTANESSSESNDLPAAYMASILTMLGMPAVLFSVLGVSMYRISRSDQEIADELTAGDAPMG